MPDLYIIDERGLQDQVGVTDDELDSRKAQHSDNYLNRLERAGYTEIHPAWPSMNLVDKWWPMTAEEF